MSNTGTLASPQQHVFSAEDMVEIAGSMPLLATTQDGIEECGDCCDSDCQGI